MDISFEIMPAKREWSEIFIVVKEKEISKPTEQAGQTQPFSFSVKEKQKLFQINKIENWSPQICITRYGKTKFFRKKKNYINQKLRYV